MLALWAQQVNTKMTEPPGTNDFFSSNTMNGISTAKKYRFSTTNTAYKTGTWFSVVYPNGQSYLIRMTRGTNPPPVASP